MITDRFSLQGKIALISGAAGFFGRHFSRAFLEAGAGVILTDRDHDGLATLHRDLTADFPNALIRHFAVDAYDSASYESFLVAADKDHRIGILVNNAFDFSAETGFNTADGAFANATYEQFQKCFTSGVYWAFQATRVIGSGMQSRGAGSIVNIGTMYADAVPSPRLYAGTSQFNPWGYSASKGALLQFTRYSAAWLAPSVRVNMLSPGAFPNTKPGTVNPPDSRVTDRLLGKILLGRMGDPSDLAPALVFLASDAARYITGQNLRVDGGITVTVT